MENGLGGPDGGANVHQHYKQDEAAMGKIESSVTSPGGHRRSVSGNLLSKLPFLKSITTFEETSPQSRSKSISGELLETATSPKQASAMASAIQIKKARRRKGSLRKAALMGTGRLRLEGRERRASNLEQVNVPQSGEASSSRDQESSSPSSPASVYSGDEMRTPRQQTFGLPFPGSVANESQTPNGVKARVGTLSDENLPFGGSHGTVTIGESSTTDDDDPRPIGRASSPDHVVSVLKKPISPSSGSYFPHQASVSRRKSSNKPKSPLATLHSEAVTTPEEWDYSETEWWGWVVLIVTWVVFVVGMGSSFGVWSWAWDVGETPYAPPELSDDPTLPIVGYYPALIILTSVMAWVWVVVAWVGMKYFKHAKISGDD